MSKYGPKPKDPVERFLARIKLPAHLHDCWEWEGGCSNTGYGSFGVGDKNTTAHRFSYEHFKGPVPEGMCICHSCDNRKCVNPRHLWLGTHANNTEDMVKKGRANGAPKKYCLPQGVYKNRKRFGARKGRKWLGTYDTPEEASQAVQKGWGFYRLYF